MSEEAPWQEIAEQFGHGKPMYGVGFLREIQDSQRRIATMLAQIGVDASLSPDDAAPVERAVIDAMVYGVGALRVDKSSDERGCATVYYGGPFDGGMR